MQVEQILQIILLFAGGYFAHYLQVRLSKKKIISDRLLANINKIEKFISLMDEIKFEESKIDEIKNSLNIIQDYNRNVRSQIDEIWLSSEKDHAEMTDMAKQIETFSRIKKSIEEKLPDYDELDVKILEDMSELTNGFTDKLHNISENLAGYKLKLAELDKELNKWSSILDTNKEKLNQSQKQLDEFQKLIALSDIDSICLIVDPKGNLGNYISSFITLNKSGEESDEILRSKIKIKIKEKLNKIIMGS